VPDIKTRSVLRWITAGLVTAAGVVYLAIVGTGLRILQERKGMRDG